MDRAYSPINILLEQASCITRRSIKQQEKLKPIEGYKGRLIKELIEFANTNNLWIDLSHLNITYMDKGDENEISHGGESSVVKLNNFEYAGDDLVIFFIRINEHNKFFR